MCFSSRCAESTLRGHSQQSEFPLGKLNTLSAFFFYSPVFLIFMLHKFSTGIYLLTLVWCFNLKTCLHLGCLACSSLNLGSATATFCLMPLSAYKDYSVTITNFYHIPTSLLLSAYCPPHLHLLSAPVFCYYLIPSFQLPLVFCSQLIMLAFLLLAFCLIIF